MSYTPSLGCVLMWHRGPLNSYCTILVYPNPSRMLSPLLHQTFPSMQDSQQEEKEGAWCILSISRFPHGSLMVLAELHLKTGEPGILNSRKFYLGDAFIFQYPTLKLRKHPQRHSPDPHFAVHNTGGVKLSQQIFHLVISLPVLDHISVVGRDIGLQDIVHEAVEAPLLRFTVLFQYPAIGCRLEAT